MRRRKFLGALGGAAVAWPLEVQAQQSAVPVVGFVSNNSRSDNEKSPHLGIALRRGLAEIGFVEGQSVAIESRWAEGHLERLPALILDLVRRRVAVIFAPGGEVPTMIAKGATTSIPIVFLTSADPVAAGLVASLNRPDGNATGVTTLGGPLGAKRLELLQQLAPNAATVGVLVNPNNPSTEPQLADLQAAARAAKRQIRVMQASNSDEFAKAFATLVETKAGALLVNPDPIFTLRRDEIVALAARLALPTLYFAREFIDIGGLVSYGASLAEAFRQCGVYVGRILKGAKPSDLPVLQPTMYETVVNLKTARALGITVPEALIVAATEVIE